MRNQLNRRAFFILVPIFTAVSFRRGRAFAFCFKRRFVSSYRQGSVFFAKVFAAERFLPFFQALKGVQRLCKDFLGNFMHNTAKEAGRRLIFKIRGILASVRKPDRL